MKYEKRITRCGNCPYHLDYNSKYRFPDVYAQVERGVHYCMYGIPVPGGKKPKKPTLIRQLSHINKTAPKKCPLRAVPTVLTLYRFQYHLFPLSSRQGEYQRIHQEEIKVRMSKEIHEALAESYFLLWDALGNVTVRPGDEARPEIERGDIVRIENGMVSAAFRFNYDRRAESIHFRG